jgi:phenylalanyl-tRNA synthetase alpha chain
LFFSLIKNPFYNNIYKLYSVPNLIMTSNYDVQSLAESLTAIERKLLPYLKDSITVRELIEQTGSSDAEVKRALMWFENRGVLSTEQKEEDLFVLEANGLLAAEHGLPEIRVLKELLGGPKKLSDLESETLPRGEILSNIGVLKKNNSITMEKVDGGDMLLTITPAGKILAEKDDVYVLNSFFKKYPKTSFPLPISSLSSEDKSLAEELSRRKNFLKKKTEKTITIHLSDLGKKLSSTKVDLSNIEEQLTSKLLVSGEWRNKKFRTYDVESPVPAISGGRRHPFREATNLIRDIYLSMGFKEMSGPWVESAFWCMDSMWIPQDHPARDEQDTFFIDGPAKLPSKELVEKVKSAHENGLDTGSTGHTRSWSEDLAKQRILRTHSTATTFRMFGEHGIGKEDGKFFYISNNFRNEAVDATHLAEFVQVEGFIVGDDLSLADLMGVIKEFYSRFGIHKIRFKPTFNPYTEPSMEAHYYDENKKKWYALINSGIFRPEALAPYGIKKTVIAWGMGGSRVAALLNRKNNLRELVGPTVDFEWIANHVKPLPNLEVEGKNNPLSGGEE